MNKNKLVFIGLSVVIMAIIAILIFQSKKMEQARKTEQSIKLEWTMETMQVDNGWGFIISMNGKPTIKQDRIPAIDKKNVFLTEESARQVGEIMLRRIQNNKRPSISKSELIELGIIDSLQMPIPQK
ncbi:DUF4907 domain-containing protein [Labilibaculum sp.]|uniref:DUF4907 domain-containing protein n=1 Tax=Labilibaculum sp. TaxID=2060723 RepID=UPI00356472E3